MDLTSFHLTSSDLASLDLTSLNLIFLDLTFLDLAFAEELASVEDLATAGLAVAGLGAAGLAVAGLVVAGLGAAGLAAAIAIKSFQINYYCSYDSVVGFVYEQLQLLTTKKQQSFSYDYLIFSSIFYNLSPHAYRFLRSSGKVVFILLYNDSTALTIL